MNESLIKPTGKFTIKDLVSLNSGYSEIQIRGILKREIEENKVIKVGTKSGEGKGRRMHLFEEVVI